MRVILLIRAQKESFKSNLILGFSSPLSHSCLASQKWDTYFGNREIIQAVGTNGLIWAHAIRQCRTIPDIYNSQCLVDC